MQRHKPPSRIRYEKKHPTVSFRLDLKTKQRLKKLLGKQSFADFVKEGLGVKEREKESLENEHEKGYREGYDQAKRVYGVQTQCDICGGKIIVTEEEAKKEIDRYLRDRGLCHRGCVEERERRRKMEGLY